jgi:hypothetical protein
MARSGSSCRRSCRSSSSGPAGRTRGETAAAPARLGRTEDRKNSNSNASKGATVVRNVRNCAADNLNVLRRCGRRNSRARRSLPKVSARDAVAGDVAVPGAERLALRQRSAHRQQRIRARHNGHRARLVLRVRRKQKAARRVPRVTADRNGEDVSGVAGRAVVTAVGRRADRLLRDSAGLLD